MEDEQREKGPIKRIVCVGITTFDAAILVMENNHEHRQSSLIEFADITIGNKIQVTGIPDGHPVIVRNWALSDQGFNQIVASNFGCDIAVVNIESKNHVPITEALSKNGFDVYRIPNNILKPIFPDRKDSHILFKGRKNEFITIKNKKETVIRSVQLAVNHGLNFFELKRKDYIHEQPVIYVPKNTELKAYTPKKK